MEHVLLLNGAVSDALLLLDVVIRRSNLAVDIIAHHIKVVLLLRLFVPKIHPGMTCFKALRSHY